MPDILPVLLNLAPALPRTAHPLWVKQVLDALTLIDYYPLRFPIEFTFRDAKQYVGLEDFMGVQEVSI